MRRRSFLKLAGLASAGAVLGVTIPVAALGAPSKVVAAGDRLYRSDGTGRISVSEDAGTTWALHSDLGPDYRVLRLAATGTESIVATVGYQAWSFKLMLAPDLRSWLTT